MPHPPPPPPPKPQSLKNSLKNKSIKRPSVSELETVTLTPTSARKLPPPPENHSNLNSNPDFSHMAQAAAKAAMRREQRMSQKSRDSRSDSITKDESKKTNELNARIEKMKESNNLALRLALDAKSQSLKKRNSSVRRNDARNLFDNKKSETSDIAEIIPTAKSPPPEFNSSEDDSGSSEEQVEPKVSDKNNTTLHNFT